MPAALSMKQRREIVERRENGESFVAIAGSMTVSYSATRNIYHRYRESGELAPLYANCRHTDVRHEAVVYEKAIALKQAHPRWGGGLIWTELAEEFAEQQLPSVRTLQRWFRRAGIQNPRPDKKPKAASKRGKKSHEVWAIDAKEDMQLADGSSVSWLTITDEGSGAILEAALFPHQALGEYQSASGQVNPASRDGFLGSPGKDQDG